MTESTVRGINHVGITVPDIDAATKFLIEALGAEVLYESFGHNDTPREGAGFEEATGAAAGTIVRSQRMIKIGTGPDIELFEMHAPDQADAARASDFGLAHLGFYVDDMGAAVARFRTAGGVTLTEPREIPYRTEKGPRNAVCYGRMPWGTTIEFITYPDTMAYTTGTSRRRWHDDTP